MRTADDVKCPCCKGKGRIPVTEAVSFSPTQEIIYRLVTQRRINGHALVEKLYGKRRDGGPTWADGCIHVNICRMNKKLAKVGKKIISLSSKAIAYYKVTDVV